MRKQRMEGKWFLFVLIPAILVLLGLLVLVYPVSADPTNTPLPTPTQPVGTLPIFPTDFHCGQGNPTGWLTLTPDPFWLMMCEQCIDRPVYYTSTPEGSATVTPTVTGTPPTPTNTPVVLGITCSTCITGSYCEQVQTDLIRINVDFSGPLGANYGQEFCDYTVASSSVVTVYGYAELQGDIWSVSQGFDGSNWSANFDLQLIGQDSWVVYAGGYLGPGLSSDEFDETFTFSNGPRDTTSRQDGGTYANIWPLAQSDRIMWQVYGDIYLSTYYLSGPPGPSPTPTSTPDVSFCTTVLEEEEEEGEGPFIEWGDSDCKKILPEVDLSWAGIDATLPETWICFQEVSFRDLELLGVTIDLMVILYVAVGAFVVSWIFKT